MIDNEDVIFENFTDKLSLKSLPEMDKNLATQLLEATITTLLISDKVGVCTALRAVCQEEAFNIRLDSCMKLANKVWTAVTRNGAYSTNGANRIRWLENFKNEVTDALIAHYATQFEEIGVSRDEIVIIGRDCCLISE